MFWCFLFEANKWRRFSMEQSCEIENNCHLDTYYIEMKDERKDCMAVYEINYIDMTMERLTKENPSFKTKIQRCEY